MPNYISMLLNLFEEHSLCDRHPELAPYQMLAQMGKLSQNVARGILIQIQDVIEHYKDFPCKIHRPPSKEQWYVHGKPDIELGSLVEAPECRFGINLTGGQHSGFIGQTDSGKTVAIRNVIFKVHEWNEAHPDHRVSIICIDPKGGDFADIPGLLGKKWRHFSVHEGLRIGTNGPSNMPANIWINHFSMNYGTRAKLQKGVICLANMMKVASAALNKKLGSELLSPSFQLLLEIAKNTPLTLFASKPDYEKSLIQTLEQVASAEVFDTFNGLNLQRDIIDLGLNAVIDTCGLTPPWAKMHITDSLINPLVLGRKYEFRKTKKIDTFLIVEEGDTEVSRKAENSFPEGGMSSIASCEKESRETGIALLLSLSAMGLVARQVLTNMNNIFNLRVQDSESLREAQQTFLLRPGGSLILPSLENGQCLLRTNNGWPHAVLGQFDNVPTSHLSRPAHFDQHNFIPSKHLHELPDVQAFLEELISKQKKNNLRQSKRTSPRNDNYAEKTLKLIIDNPYKPMKYLWRDLGNVPPFIQTSIRKKLENKGLVRFTISRLSRRNLLLPLPTELAYKRSGLQPPKQKTRGDIKHAHFIHWVWKAGKQQGHKVKKEAIAPGTNHPVDVMWWVEDELWAFECISKCEENIIGHLQACFIDSKQIAIVTIVAEQQQILNRIKKAVREEFSLARFDHRIRYELVSKYLEVCWK